MDTGAIVAVIIGALIVIVPLVVLGRSARERRLAARPTGPRRRTPLAQRERAEALRATIADDRRRSALERAFDVPADADATTEERWDESGAPVEIHPHRW